MLISVLPFDLPPLDAKAMPLSSLPFAIATGHCARDQPAACVPSSGIRAVKRVPEGAVDSTSRRPAWARTICAQMCSPRPRPSRLADIEWQKKGWKMRARLSGGIGVPRLANFRAERRFQRQLAAGLQSE